MLKVGENVFAKVNTREVVLPRGKWKKFEKIKNRDRDIYLAFERI